METPFCTFQYYDKKGRRLAVFCRYLNATEAEIFILTCSHADQFNKNYARKVYQAYLDGIDLKFEAHKPKIELIVIEPERREIYTLLAYCRKNYYEPVEIEVPVTVLFNEGTEHIIF